MSNQEYVYYHLDFNKCKDDDFKKRGLEKMKIRTNKYSNLMICPDFDTHPELIKV